MKKTNFVIFGIVFLFVFLLNISAQNEVENEQYVYIVVLNNSNGTLSLDDVALSKGGLPNTFTEGENYTTKIISLSGSILYEMKFSVPESIFIFGSADPSWFDEEGNQIYIPTAEETGQQEITNFPVILVLPYFPNAEKIEIYSPEDELLLNVDVSEFAVCESDENCNLEEHSDALQKFIGEMDKKLLEQLNQPLIGSGVSGSSGKFEIPWYIYTLIGILVVAIILTIIMIVRVFIRKKTISPATTQDSNL